jgi:hypothetical protein
MYLVNGTRLNITFVINLLSRFNSAPTKRHGTSVKQIFHYLHGAQDLGLFFKKNQDLNIVEYPNVR